MTISALVSGMTVPLRGPAIATSRGSIEAAYTKRFLGLAKIRPDRFGSGGKQDNTGVASHAFLHAVRLEKPVEQSSLKIINPTNLLGLGAPEDAANILARTRTNQLFQF